MHASRFFVDAGGLMSYGATQSEIYTMAAEQVAKILDGAGALLLGACTTAKSTPQQDLVWSEYKQCKAEGRVPSNIQLDRVEPGVLALGQ